MDTSYSVKYATEKRKINEERDHYPFSKELMPQPIEGNINIADIGCGVGEFSVLMKSYGYNVVCCDINKNSLDHVSHLGFQTHHVDLNKQLPFSENMFDGIILLGVIEHVVNSENLISEISRIAKPGAFLLINTPNTVFIRHRLTALLGMPPPNESYHFRYFTKKTLTDLLNTNRFSIARRNSFGTLPGINLLRRIFSKKIKYFNIPAVFENLLAYEFVWLCRKK